MRASATASGASRTIGRMVLAIVLLALLGTLGVGPATAERQQFGNLVVSLDGGLSPLTLPRDRQAPVAVHLAGNLQTVDHSLLPRVTRMELGLAGAGILSIRGLPACPQGRLRNTKRAEALAACRGALVGRGRLAAAVPIRHQAPFSIHASLLAFNSRVGGRRALILYGFSANPPTSVVVPFLIERRPGRFGVALVANLPKALGPLPRLARFEMTLSRRFRAGGRTRSYLSASCPLPPRLTSGFFSFARAAYTLAGGARVSSGGITRSCRAR